jgi:putative SOS response-associated peptidase YedK
MCGRYSFAPDLKVVNEHYDITVNDGDIPPNYNCAPSQLLPVVTNDNADRISFFKWGLIPFWAKNPAIGYKMINARGETIAEKPSFKNAFARRRCLVPADGFYEWKKLPDGKTKIPYRIFLPGRPLFSMAGLWETWKSPEGEHVHSFTIITTTPNDLMEGIHDRMPVILEKQDEKMWLEEKNQKALLELIKPFDSNRMDAYQISSMVNSPRNNSPEIIEPVA